MSVMVFNQSGGGGEAIKLIVLASAASLPASAKDNTLAIITSVTVGDVRVQHTAPTTPADGDVWIMTSVSGGRALQVGRKNLLTTHLVRAYQYVSSEWVLKDLYVRVSGAWQNTHTYLYSRGTEFVTAHGFVTTKLSTSDTYISKQSTYMIGIPSAAPDNWKGIYWDAIDLEAYNTLRLVVSTPNGTETVGYGNSTSTTLETLSQGLDESVVDVNIAALNGSYKLWIGRSTLIAQAFRVYEALLI